MYGRVRDLAILGAVVLFVLFGGAITDEGRALASFDFTFTCDQTVIVASTWDTVQFHAILTNTGTEADSYLVTLAENPPTPEEWRVEFCAGGVCYDTVITSAKIYTDWPLDPGWTDDVLLDVIPRTEAQGDFTITIESLSSPGLKLTKSLNFLLNAHEEGQVPVTQNWGLVILTMLILSSGLYLMYRRLKLAKQT